MLPFLRIDFISVRLILARTLLHLRDQNTSWILETVPPMELKSSVTWYLFLVPVFCPAFELVFELVFKKIFGTDLLSSCISWSWWDLEQLLAGSVKQTFRLVLICFSFFLIYFFVILGTFFVFEEVFEVVLDRVLDGVFDGVLFFPYKTSSMVSLS